jgi:radical SAM/Cys-rich protein
MKTLNAVQHELSIPLVQLRILSQEADHLASFEEKLDEAGQLPLRSGTIEILQINLGKMCNQTCAHCHVDAGPDRKEIMTRETMESCLSAVRRSGIQTVDLTGGAPEMNPHFRWFVERLTALGTKVMVRSNLTILTVNGRYRQLPAFFARHGLTVISSLPCYTAANTDKQRGDGVFEKSLKALRSLNELGYGREGSGLELNLVYNPLGAFLPGPQKALETDYKRVLTDDFGIEFNRLFCITNMPINRFLDYLISSGKYDDYMRTLVEAFNPAAALGVMCRNSVSVGWDGTLFDCDFNQMLDLTCADASPQDIADFDRHRLEDRPIVVGRHCFGCTAGAGSSCGGEIV